MANPQAQTSPPPFSPNPMSPNPMSPNPMSPTSTNPYAPNKRPRLSPTTSPYASPQIANGQLPNPGFSPQYDANGPNGLPSGSHLDVPHTPTGGSMGPPSRPVEEKAPGIDDLSDVLYGSGIDIREEETALQGRSGRLPPSASFTTQSTSFASNTEATQPHMLDAYVAPHYSSNLPGGPDSFYGAGVFNQVPVSPDLVQQHADEAKRERIRQYNIRKQFELNDPFLSGPAVWNRLHREAQFAHTKLPTPTGGLPQQQNYRKDIFTLGGPQTEGVRPLGETQRLISSDGIVADALTLISLATRERVRALLEDAGTIARARRETAHGIVPPELADIASGAGQPTEATYEDPLKANPLKRSYSEANALPSPVSDDHTQTKASKTVAYPNQLASSVSKMQESFRKLEEARAERRGKRKAKGVLAGEQSRTNSAAATPTPGTPGPGDVAPRMTKKEQKRQADARANEAQQHAATSNAVNLALGGGFGIGQKKKKISWMTSKQPATDSFAAPKRQSSSQPSGTGSKGGIPQSRTLGNFREDREDGRGIQLRDLVLILEPDLREKKALSRAYNRMGSTR